MNEIKFKTGQRWHCIESKYGDFYFVILGKGVSSPYKRCRVIPDKNNPGIHNVFDAEYSHAHIKRYGTLQLNGTVDDFISIICPHCKKFKDCPMPKILDIDRDKLIMDNCNNFE